MAEIPGSVRHALTARLWRDTIARNARANHVPRLIDTCTLIWPLKPGWPRVLPSAAVKLVSATRNDNHCRVIGHRA
jgi:hypothetical protein